METKSKLPDVGVTIFTRMTALSLEHDAINLAQGFPDFDPDPALFDLIERHMRRGMNQYAPMQGVPALRERISETARALYGANYSPEEEVTVTSGATEALFGAIMAFIGTGDEVILFEPAYDSYGPAVRLAGGVPVYCRLVCPEYSIDWNGVKDAVTPKTRMMILNSPHNPSGAVLSPGDLEALREITAGTGILILSDEVYEHIIFDGALHQSMARVPELAARSLVVGSFGKTYHATGWKVGYCLAPAALTAELRKVHQYITFATSTPMQHAYAEYMERGGSPEGLAAFYQGKRDLFLSLIAGSRFRFTPSRGTYFQMLDYSAISDEADIDFARRITAEHGVSAIPPSVFYHDVEDNRVLRFCFAKKDETLERAAERLCAI
ncbi:MAG: methionine aminotransferase [Spirochaetes bacterium]|nr:methionine aminotransferase [Spirochaetota bacterium]